MAIKQPNRNCPQCGLTLKEKDTYRCPRCDKALLVIGSCTGACSVCNIHKKCN